MKWFKHYTNAHKGDVFQTLSAEFGKVQAYGWYFLLVEYLADMWDGRGEPKFRVTMPALCGHLTATPRRLRRYLAAMERSGKIKVTENGKLLDIEFPKLAEIRHRDAMSAGARPGKIPSNSSVEEEEKRTEEKKRKLSSFATFLKNKISVITQDTWNTKYGKEFVLEHGSEAYSFFSNDEASSSWTTMTWVSKVGASLERSKARADEKANTRTSHISGVVPD
jgi:hypothetical protein